MCHYGMVKCNLLPFNWQSSVSFLDITLKNQYTYLTVRSLSSIIFFLNIFLGSRLGKSW